MKRIKNLFIFVFSICILLVLTNQTVNGEEITQQNEMNDKNYVTLKSPYEINLNYPDILQSHYYLNKHLQERPFASIDNNVDYQNKIGNLLKQFTTALKIWPATANNNTKVVNGTNENGKVIFTLNGSADLTPYFDKEDVVNQYKILVNGGNPWTEDKKGEKVDHKKLSFTNKEITIDNLKHPIEGENGAFRLTHDLIGRGKGDKTNNNYHAKWDFISIPIGRIEKINMGAKNIELQQGDKWDPKLAFLGGTNENGQPLQLTEVTIDDSKVNTNSPGKYPVTFCYVPDIIKPNGTNNEKLTKTITVTVKPKIGKLDGTMPQSIDFGQQKIKGTAQLLHGNPDRDLTIQDTRFNKRKWQLGLSVTKSLVNKIDPNSQLNHIFYRNITGVDKELSNNMQIIETAINKDDNPVNISQNKWGEKGGIFLKVMPGEAMTGQYEGEFCWKLEDVPNN